jgi:hypothetical protein
MQYECTEELRPHERVVVDRYEASATPICELDLMDNWLGHAAAIDIHSNQYSSGSY